ncbi:uncharacterized protein LOC143914786 [Arctopsyche grandis]|uniref:uncharacterized protein LOC143914786 n=1 Tax=Arctopsyche grandis TaxID=121162 RepID=UPI00406D6413
MAKRRYFDIKQWLLLGLVMFYGVACQIDNESQLVNRVSACEVCLCTNVDAVESSLESFIDIECIHKNKEIALNSLMWPVNNQKSISISVIGFEIPSVQKILKNEFVKTLQLNSNNIKTTWPMAFSDLTNLEYLSLAYNQLGEVTPDMFHNLRMLKELNLSNNKLSEFNQLDFSQLKSLKLLKLEGNSIVKIPIPALDKIETLKGLNLSRNKIFLLNFNDGSEHFQILEKLKILDISYNKLTVITKDTFQRASLLEYLDLSNNQIQNIEENAFKNCKSLRVLNLSWNEISTLTTFPPFIQSLHIAKNSLIEWPSCPESLTFLDISQNQLINMFNEKYINFDNIQILNVSRNQLQTFEIVKPLTKLSVLDISYNLIEGIPHSFDSNSIPSIEDLTIDGNPIEQLIFESELSLRKFSAKNMSRIKIIKANELKIKAKTSTGDLDQCIDISISHCNALSKIEAKAFNDISICHLDLSYNNLKSISKIENKVNRGINLQGNPWDCSCDLQWILDDLLQEFYINHAALLHELRCDSPRQFKGLRFVHWYKWGERAFCSDSRKSRHMENYLLSESTSGSAEDGTLGSHTIIMIVLFIAILVLFIVAAALIVYLIKGKYRHSRQIRRKMTRQRQTMADSEQARMNGENFALNNA